MTFQLGYCQIFKYCTLSMQKKWYFAVVSRVVAAVSRVGAGQQILGAG